MLHNPLEQFDVLLLHIPSTIIYIYWIILGFALVLWCTRTKYIRFLSRQQILIHVFLLFILCKIAHNNFIIYSCICSLFIVFILAPRRIQIGNYCSLEYVLYQTVLFVQGILQQNTSVYKSTHLIWSFSIFFIIGICNICGVLPYSLTPTSHLIVTFYISLGAFIGTNITGIFSQKQNVFDIFLPDGVPMWVVPLLVVIEIVSYFARIFSLSIRLFANMLAGHVLLKILGSFWFDMMYLPTLFKFFSVFPTCIVLGVSILETSIAFLQAYVFVTLLVIYLNDIIDPH